MCSVGEDIKVWQLFPQIKFVQEFLVFSAVFLLKIIKKPAAFPDQDQEPAAGMEIFLMKLEMIS